MEPSSWFTFYFRRSVYEVDLRRSVYEVDHIHVLDNMQWQLYEFEYNLSHLLLEYGFTGSSLIFIGVAYNVYGCFTNCVLGKVMA